MNASTPPVMAVNRNALITTIGPTNEPIAAISFTSPAPVAPSACPGSISKSPNTNPSAAAPSEMPLNPDAANPIPAPAIDAVTALGMRRVRISTIEATHTPDASATKAQLETVGKVLRYVVPEERRNGVAHARHRANRHEGNQRDQQGVFEQVLPVLVRPEELCSESPHRGPRMYREALESDPLHCHD